MDDAVEMVRLLGGFVVLLSFFVLLQLLHEKLTGQKLEAERSRKPWRLRKMLILSLIAGVLAGMVNGDMPAGGFDTSRTLSAFLLYALGIPIFSTLGLLISGRFGFGAMGQLTGIVYASWGGLAPLIRILLAQFGYHYSFSLLSR